jgi:hypothetical protein
MTSLLVSRRYIHAKRVSEHRAPLSAFSRYRDRARHLKIPGLLSPVKEDEAINQSEWGEYLRCHSTWLGSSVHIGQ